MLGSMFALLTVTAAVLLVPAFAALLAVQRHRHVAPGEDGRRWVRLAVAATCVAFAALGVAALLGAGPVSAAVVAVVLAGSVLAWAPLSRSWAVRGVVMWALLVTTAVALLGWLVQQMVASSMSGTEIAITAGVTLVLGLALSRGQGYVRRSIAAQTDLGPRTSARPGMPVVRPLMSLAVLLAAGGGVLAVTSDESGPDALPVPPQAGGTGAPSTPGAPTVGTPTLSKSPHAPGIRSPRGALGAGSAGSLRGPVTRVTPRPDLAATTPAGTPARHVLAATQAATRVRSAAGNPRTTEATPAPRSPATQRAVATPRAAASTAASTTRQPRYSAPHRLAAASTFFPEPAVPSSSPSVTFPPRERGRRSEAPGHAKPRPHRNAPSSAADRRNRQGPEPLPPQGVKPGNGAAFEARRGR